MSTAAGPIRTCVGCGERKAQDNLVRITAQDGRAAVGRQHPGRGAWLCHQQSCLAEAAKRRAFSRAFRCKIADEDFAATLSGWLN